MGRTREDDDEDDAFPIRGELRGHPLPEREKAFQHKDDDDRVKLARPTPPDAARRRRR